MSKIIYAVYSRKCGHTHFFEVGDTINGLALQLKEVDNPPDGLHYTTLHLDESAPTPAQEASE